MKINLIRLSNSLDPNATFKKEDDRFIEDLNNELFDDDIELVSDETKSPFSMILIETGGSEQHFVKIEKDLPRPIILISTCKNNSLPACLEIKTYLSSRGEDPILLFGDEKELASTIKDVSRILSAKEVIDNATLGVIGKPSDWLIASVVDYKKVKEKFNINLIDITTLELKIEIDKGILDNIPRLDLLKKIAKDDQYFDGALKIYSGLKRIVEKYHLKGLTIRCFDLIQEYQNTACLALAMLNDEGSIGTCEGDIPSLLTMFFVKAASGLASFQANPSKINLRDSSILFAHCTIPMSICKDVKFMTHFESGLGIGIRGELEKRDISIVKLCPDLENALYVTGDIIKNETLPNYCRTQIEVKLNDERDLLNFIREDFGNHVIIAYGNIVPEFVNVLHYYNQLYKKNTKE